MLKMELYILCVFVLIIILNSGKGILNEQSMYNITSTSTARSNDFTSTSVTPVSGNTIPTLPPEANNYDPFYDFYYQGREQLTWDAIREVLNSNDTLAYLSKFNSGFERDIIYHQLESCPLTNLCDFRLQFDTYYIGTPCCKSCICDFPKCLKRMTCCLDTLIENIDIDDVDVVDEEKVVSKQETNCVSLHLANSAMVEETDIFDGALMIDSCPKDTNESLSKNCTRPYTSGIRDFNDVTPVMNIVNAVVYRNIYCAYCHKVQDNELAKANAQISCEHGLTPRTEQEIITAVVENRKCHLMFQRNDRFVVEKCTVSVDECNKTGKWFEFDATIKKACNLYTHPILVQNTFYKNPFCAMCNGFNITDIECDIDPGTSQFTFSGLLKLENGEDGSSNVYVNDGKCSANQLYDYILNICRDILCPPLTHFNNGACREIFSQVEAVVYNLYMKIIPLNSTTVLMAYQLTDSIVDYLSSLPLIGYQICGLQLMYHCQENIMNKTYEEIEKVEVKYYKLRVQAYQTSSHSPSEVYDNYILLHRSRHRISYFDYEAKKYRDFEVYFELDDFSPEIFNILADVSVSSINLEKNLTYSTDKPLPLKVVLDIFTVSDNHTGSDIPYIKDYFFPLGTCVTQKEEDAINILHYKDCPKILISKGEPVWVRTDNGVRFVQENFNVSNSEFFFDFNGNILICTGIYKEYMTLFIEAPMAAMEIVSIVFSSMSILTLLFTFTVFLIIPRLWNHLPGKINMSLILVLLCAQCMYLICSFGGIRIGSWECVVIGIFLHYFWLLSFMWMNISTYHMYHVITRSKIASSTPGICRLIVYHAYAAIMAALPVVINIIASNITSGSSGYGDPLCYISSQIMVVYTFAIPLGLVILGNVCMYVLVVCKIKRAPSVQKSVQHERNNLIIFVKLSTVTGATWLFGLMYVWTDFIAMSYISIVLNAGQGMFIMYSLILNRRVLNMFSSDVLGRSVTASDTRGTTPH